VRRAVLVIDVQRSLCEGAFETVDSARVIDRINHVTSHTEPTDTFLRRTAADSFHLTALDALLKREAIAEVVICGMQTDFCVDTTTRRALALGYPVVLVSDGHTTLDNRHLSAAQIIDHHNETLSNIRSFGPVVRLEHAQHVRFGA
jgi:nicotinamidase-related amidase